MLGPSHQLRHASTYRGGQGEATLSQVLVQIIAHDNTGESRPHLSAP